MMRKLNYLVLGAIACGSSPDPKTADGASDSAVPDSIDTDDCIDDASFFADEAAPLLDADCATCHVAGGAASATAYVWMPLAEEGALDANYAMLQHLVDTLGADTVLAKPTAQLSHGGGLRFDVLDAEYAVMHELVARIQQPGACAHPGRPPLTCDDGGIHPGAAPLRRLTDLQYAALVEDTLDVVVPEGVFPATPLGGGFRTAASVNTVSAAGAESILLAAEHVADHVLLDDILDCGDTPEACGRTWLLDRGAALWRRPLSDAEQTLLTRFLDAGLGAEEGVRMGLFVALQAPQALYLDARASDRVRQTDDPSQDVHTVDSFAVASRLSFFVTDAPPDAELLAAAAAGELSTREGVANQARRLVASAGSTGVVARFHQDWLDLHLMRDMLKDTERFPQWDDALVDAMFAETDLFTTEVVWSGEATFDALMFSPTSWVTPALADIYGVSSSDGWNRVGLDPDTRPGVLSRTGFLTAHSYAAASAPVRRGAWVVENLLCEDLVPPPGIDTTLPEESEDIQTIRDKLAAHAADPACRSCHDRIDPIGFSMEHFDGLAAWRDEWDSGIPVDATGSLDDPSGDFDGFSEMIALVGTSERARACYAQRWFEYALGRPAGPGDACSLRMLANRFEDTGGDIRGLLVDVALTDAFLYRTTNGLDPHDTAGTHPEGGDDASE